MRSRLKHNHETTKIKHAENDVNMKTTIRQQNENEIKIKSDRCPTSTSIGSFIHEAKKNMEERWDIYLKHHEEKKKQEEEKEKKKEKEKGKHE